MSYKTAPQRSDIANGRSAAFLADVRAIFGSFYAECWLAGGINCEFADGRVYTTRLGADRLVKDCNALVLRHGIRIFACPDVTERFWREVARSKSKPAPASFPRFDLEEIHPWEPSGIPDEERSRDADRWRTLFKIKRVPAINPRLRRDPKGAMQTLQTFRSTAKPSPFESVDGRRGAVFDRRSA